MLREGTGREGGLLDLIKGLRNLAVNLGRGWLELCFSEVEESNSTHLLCKLNQRFIHWVQVTVVLTSLHHLLFRAGRTEVC